MPRVEGFVLGSGDMWVRVTWESGYMRITLVNHRLHPYMSDAFDMGWTE